LLKARQPGLAVERFIRAVRDEDGRRLDRRDVLLEVAEPVRRRAKPGAGMAKHRVAAPAEVAERDVSIRIPARQSVFPVAVALLALDQRAAEEYDAIAVLEFLGSA